MRHCRRSHVCLKILFLACFVWQFFYRVLVLLNDNILILFLFCEQIVKFD